MWWSQPRGSVDMRRGVLSGKSSISPGVVAQNSGLVAADHDRHRRNYRRNHRRKYRSGRGPGLAHVDHGTTLAERTRIHPHLLV
jgi:hypothetical protein